ncbi:MAG: hypothetical protein KDE63_03605 [Novosphingobium sp.]|nr:hypothetical protein [Novosphingobium sp.]
MAETTSKTGTRKRTSKAETASGENTTEAKAKFTKAMEEARAGAEALGKEAQDRVHAYGEQFRERSEDWQAQAKKYSEQAMGKAGEFANEGKVRTSSALSGLGKMVSDNAETIDEKLGTKYGDYARSAAKSLQDTADKLDSKSVEDLGEDAKEFVRKSPGLAVGMAAVAGFMIARMFRGSRD